MEENYGKTNSSVFYWKQKRLQDLIWNWNITGVIFNFANKEINVISRVKDFAKYGQIREILYP